MELAALRFLLYSTFVLMCSAFPAGTVMGASSNSFGVSACRNLPSREVTVCSIDYQVPASIAALTDIIEYHINGKVDELVGDHPGSDSCRPAYSEALCAFYFPRCDGPNVIMRSAPNCIHSTRTCNLAVRTLIEVEGICSLNATAPLDSCNALSEYEAYGNFQRCSVVDRSTKVTAWMAEYMKVIDHEWTSKLAEGSIISSLSETPACADDTSMYYCQFFGKCTDNGEIELSNSERFCDSVLDCYADMTADSLRSTISCSLWAPVVIEPPTDKPVKPTSKPTPSIQVPSKWPNPIVVENGVSQSLHSVYWTGISLIVLASSFVLL